MMTKKKFDKIMKDFPWVWSILDMWHMPESEILVKPVINFPFNEKLRQNQSLYAKMICYYGKKKYSEYCPQIIGCNSAGNNPIIKDYYIRKLSGELDSDTLLQYLVIVTKKLGQLPNIVIYKPPKGEDSLNDIILKKISMVSKP